MGDTQTPETGTSGGVERRRFLTWLVAAPTLMVAARWGLDVPSACAADAPAPDPGGDPAGPLHRPPLGWARPTTLPRTEMGQGITTGVAMLVAEELDAPLVRGRAQRGRGSALAHPAHRTVVDNALSVRSPSRSGRRRPGPADHRRCPPLAGAGPHALHRQRRGARARRPSRHLRRAGSGGCPVLIPEVPRSPSPRAPIRWSGRPTGRLDARDIVTGAARYTLDLVSRAPCRRWSPGLRRSRHGADRRRLRRAGDAGRRGHRAACPTGVAVAAQTFAQALAARDALRITWAPGPAAPCPTRRSGPSCGAAMAPAASAAVHDADAWMARFDFPYAPHAPLEVHSCVATRRGGPGRDLDGARSRIIAQREVAEAIGWPPPQRVTLHPCGRAGSFGHRFFFEPAVEAAQVSKALGRPVKLMWTRNDDMRHGRMRPRAITRCAPPTARQRFDPQLSTTAPSRCRSTSRTGSARRSPPPASATL